MTPIFYSSEDVQSVEFRLLRKINWTAEGGMALSDLNDRNAVIAAIAEFDKLGRDKFLATYGFGEARSYYLKYAGRLYDSKAIAGVAYGIQYPDLGPLKASKFTGGNATVRRILEAIGFEFQVLRETSHH